MPHISHKGTPITPFREDRVKWNQDWEEDIAWSLRTPGERPIDLIRDICLHLATEESEAEMQHMLAWHRELYGRLCQALPSLAHAAAVAFATNDFPKKWLGVQASVRQEHILEALGRSCGEEDYGDFFRWLCDELTLPFLQKGGGQGFLDLLKHFTLDDYSLIPKEPIYLESSHWYPADPAAEPKTAAAYELADAEFNVQRSYLIARTVHETLRSFLGISNQATKPLPEKRDVAKSGIPEMIRKFMAYEPAAMKKIRKQSRRYSTHPGPRVSLCESCGISESPGGERFMRCKACTEKVSRQIYYCSRECQRKDWKRHKIICGKPMTVSESHESAISAKPIPSTPGLIGPPVNGFKRSPALVYQVNMLNQNVADDVDYLLVTRTQRVFRCKIEHPGEKRAFRTFRDMALTTGDRQAVAAMGEFLVKGPGGAVGLLGGCVLGGPVVQMGMDRQDALDQLTREFGFHVESAVNALERKRADGLTWVEMELLSQG
ncbi:hypothetical protein B0H16DRAFT_1773024 [Mycena metata]|uniref:MYND-type domain-containing protein n=1 Tax=Mycena metata TaxID=1033252 RepID=A0AAD7HYT9_9AGAR|nr:hypothetical protein B0H16DRAFT_1773024 [Mycena metata]